MDKNEILAAVDEALTSVWVNEIRHDYKSGWLLKEDTLKNALYFHLRKKLEHKLIENDLRIFTEFTDNKFKHSGYRPDMVIARVDTSFDGYLGDAVVECPVVIEIKFKNGFAPNREIYADYEKIKYYVENLSLKSRIYMITIWEYEDDESAWLTENTLWAHNRVIELNASYKRDSDSEMQFYIVRH